MVRADWQDLDTEDFNDYDVILRNYVTIGVDLANVWIDLYERSGGLGVYGGDKLDLDSYNAQLYGEEVSLLPGELTGMAEFEGSGLEENHDEAYWTIGPIQSDHVLAKLAASIPEEGRNAAKIRKVLQVKSDASADTLLTLSLRGLPLLLEKRVGCGHSPSCDNNSRPRLGQPLRAPFLSNDGSAVDHPLYQLGRMNGCLHCGRARRGFLHRFTGGCLCDPG